MRLSLLIAAIAIGCTAQPSGDTGSLPAEMAVGAATPNCTFALEGKSPVNLKTAGLCFALMCSQVPAACHNNPTPNPPNPDAGTGGAMSTGGRSSVGGNVATGGVGPVELPICTRACDNLKALGCPESQSTCVALCNLHSSDDRFTQNLDCRVNAKTKAEAQKCGVASCR
jgi:hypothetical protein